MGDPEAPQTLAAGELVWAKTKGRPHWCPARLPAACPASSKDAPVACFGDDPSAAARATRLRRFADPDADKMARDAAARGFLSAVDMAHAAAVALLCTGLTCACASPAPPPAGSTAEEDAVVVSGVANLSPSEFLASLRHAALDPAVGLVDRARLKSWTRALAQGWGPAGAGRYPRRSVEELVDKIDLDDLNEPAAGEEVDAAAADEDSDKVLEEKPLKTPAQKRRKGRPRKDASLPKEDPDDAGDRDPDQEEDEKGDQSGGSPETALTTGRKRKKSKYLSPPYTNLSTIVLEDKKAGSPKEALPNTAAKVEKKKVPRDNVDAREVLELVRSFGDGSFCEYDFPKPEERFLGLFRSSRFAVGVDIATLVSDSGAALKLGKSVLERSRKKDEAGIAGASSVKRNKKMDKTSPTATLDFPAENVDFPMENAVATDGADVAGLVSGKGVKKRTAKKDQDGSGGPSVKRKKVEKTSPKATPTLPAQNANTSSDGIGLVPHSCATLEEGKGETKRGRKKKDQDGSATPEEGKGVSKRGRKKKDQDGSGGPSVKRKMMKKTSPTAIPDSGLVITPAVPIRQVRGEDMLNQMKSGAGAGIGVGILDHNKLDQGDGGSVVKTPVTVESTLPETDVNVESVVADLPAKVVQAEEAKPAMGIQVDMNVQSGIVDVPISGAQMETMELETSIPAGTNEQVVGTDLPVTSGLFPNKHGSISEPADGNTDAASVEVRTAQDSYASLEAMVPEMYKKVDDEIATGMDVTAMGHAFIADGRKGDQTSQKTTASEAIANHAPAVSTNGACSDTNSTPKRRTKKAPQSFANPAEILLEFHGGAILPSKEELLLEFSKFGVLIEPLCGMLEDIHGARVVFGKSAEAEAVYSNGAKPGAFGQFGPPFANMKRLNYLPQYMPSIPPPAPAPKLPLGVADMRKNVENMISSLAGKKAAAATSSSAGASPVPENLLGEMQRLLLKLDSMQGGPSSGSAGAPPL